MITKINSCKPYTANTNNPSTSYCTPAFKGRDEFVRSTGGKTITEAISSILSSISSNNFSERVLFSNPDKQIILNDLCLKTEKTQNKINLEVTYNHPKVSGSIPLASGSVEEVKKVLMDKDFIKNLNKKLREASDNALFGKTERFED